jgi:FixJ family two-component response regulator
MACRSLSGEERYEGRIDVRHAMRHCSSAGSPENSGRDTRRLLSVVVVDDDESVRESLPDLLREFGFAAQAFSSARDFLSSGCVDETSCLILDVAMPGMSGLELQRELKRLGQEIPIIFITGRKDETIRIQALKQGAAGFLLKPFSDAALLASIKTALQAS